MGLLGRDDINLFAQGLWDEPPLVQLLLLKMVRRYRSCDMDQPARMALKHHINFVRHQLGRCY